MMKTHQFAVIVFCLISLSSCFPKEDLSPVVTEIYSDAWSFRAGEGDSTWRVQAVDSFWTEVTASQNLKEQNITLENGFAWYRKSITLSEDLQESLKKKGAAIIHLGRFAACDEVYLNGKLVGKTGEFPHNYMGYFDGERSYIVYEEDWNTEGENVIAIKFHDGWSQNYGFLDGNSFRISSATTVEKLSFTTQVGDSDYIFMAENPIEITTRIENNNKWAVEGRLFITFTSDDYRPLRSDSLDVKIEGQKTWENNFTYNNPLPGFYRYTLQFEYKDSIVSEKKLNVGYEPEKIASPIDAAADFKTFWDNNLKELAKVKPNYKLTPIPEASKLDYNMYLVEMNSFGNELIRGYYAQPKKEGKHPVIVEYMGYGSQPHLPNQTWDGFAYFVLSIRGQALNLPENKYGTWITYGLDNKDNYYYRGAFLDVVRALDFVSSRPEIDADKIAVRGGSQGGALSFVAASLDKRVKAAAPNIPFLSDYRDYFAITHWPRSDFEEYMRTHPEAQWENIYSLLTYFDIKNLAQWIECPLIMGIGVQDEVCPPHINFAAYNQVRSEKCWMAFPQFGHSVGKEFYDAQMAFFKEKLNVK